MVACRHGGGRENSVIHRSDLGMVLSGRTVLAVLGTAGVVGGVGAARVAGVRRPVDLTGEWYRSACDRRRAGCGRERDGPGPALTRRWSTEIPRTGNEPSPVLVDGGVHVLTAPDVDGGDDLIPIRLLRLDPASGRVERDTVVTRTVRPPVVRSSGTRWCTPTEGSTPSRSTVSTPSPRTGASAGTGRSAVPPRTASSRRAIRWSSMGPCSPRWRAVRTRSRGSPPWIPGQVTNAGATRCRPTSGAGRSPPRMRTGRSTARCSMTGSSRRTPPAATPSGSSRTGTGPEPPAASPSATASRSPPPRRGPRRRRDLRGRRRRPLSPLTVATIAGGGAPRVYR